MPLRTRSGRRVVTRRKRTFRRKPRKSGLVKMVRRQARITQLKNTETKRFFILDESYNLYTAATGSFYYNYNFVNVFGALAQGFGQNNFLGDTIDNVLTKVKFQITIRWNALANILVGSPTLEVPEIFCHVWLIATNDQYPAVTPQNMAAVAGVSDWFLQIQAGRVQMNGDSIKVIKHWTKKFRAYDSVFTNGATVQTVHIGKLVKKLKGKKTYEPSSRAAPNAPSQFLKGWNYYYLTGWGLPDGQYSIATPLANNPVRMTMDRYLYFKDP